jgi:hypothetical protein
LGPILKDFLPILASTKKIVTQYFNDYPHLTFIQRTIGQHNFTLTHPVTGESVVEKRMVFPYSLWMLQRVADCYHQHSSDINNKVLKHFPAESRAFLEDLFQLDQCRVKREQNQLVRDVEWQRKDVRAQL